ncbi:DMT family transporter [Georgenia sp. 10Sc9-8]|uniref:DMT family transporter n=1 Tax=Georgenia halotolerans TaxID=3028317 RepID=A0ABT5TXX6_9MICO|nr:DMT family transporter [Georgenia halotolerans]
MPTSPLTTNGRWGAYLSCVLVVVFYSGNILTGSALADLPPFTVAFFRVVIATVVLLPLGWRAAYRDRSVFRHHARPLLFLTITGVTFFNTFIYAALHFTSASNVSVLETVIPVVTALLSAWLLRERLRWVQWAGVMLSLAGAVWVVLAGSARSGAGRLNAGDLIMLAAIVSWSLYSIGVKRYMHLFPAYGVVLVMTGLSVVVLLPFAVGEWVIGGMFQIGHWPFWSGLLYLGIFPSVVALILYNRAVMTLGASQASVFLNFLPVVTMLGAYVLLDETITLPQIFGATLVVAGVLLTTTTAPAAVTTQESPDPASPPGRRPASERLQDPGA